MSKPPTRRQHNSTLPGRTAPMARSGRPAAGPRTPVKARNPKRKASEFARCYGSRERVRWVKSLRCIAAHHGCVGPIQNAHTENGGMGRKADARTIVPACRFHHAQMHNGGVQWFEGRYDLDLHALAASVEACWQLHVAQTAGLVHVSAIVPRVLRAMQEECE